MEILLLTPLRFGLSSPMRLTADAGPTETLHGA